MTLRVDVSLRDALLATHTFADRERVVVGRHASCDVVIENLALSREHAAIAWERGEWVVRDLGSRNGVYVNGQKKPVHALASGDVIGLGKYSLAVSLTGAHAPARKAAWTHPGAVAGAHLVVKRGEPTGVFSLERDVFSVGGHKSCELRLRGALAPRRLAMIVRGLGGYSLVNVSARAEAVWKNGKPVPDRCWLEDGDRLELLDVLARFAAGPAGQAG
ncbi:MAG: FHA domain-containing protein [Planctomycetes bacterium]|nr:FHA domain-containing protein [Planctomycetota bacterium]